ncbi:MAG: putative major capsid protein [Prokaryotic dsDNA virus sp.]|nr:MAG: putative major capsid protein [Prokaryotic dsDNA virus sp.]|tara:strand:+ start:29949 stop:30896 length:948 start_codon:yes stop_codon:yes gene_type:complete
MAQPSNTFDSYDAVGIREDLSDIIHDVSPEETPFYSACGKSKARNTYHEWMTDSLRASAANAHIEGDATTAEARTATTRLGNYTQIFKNAVIIPGTDEGLEKAGRAKEMAYQTLRIAKEQKLDIEKALFDNNARVAGDSSTARELAGLPSWIITNIDEASDATVATGNGTDARTDGTAAAFSQTRFDGVMQSIWESGGNPDTVYLSAFQMNKALAFDGNNNQRSNITAESEKVIKHMSVYVTPWGTVKFVPSREQRGSDVFVIQDDMFEVAVLRPTKNEALAKDGDYEKRQVLTELTLVAKNEKSSGAVYDCTTS